MSIYEPLEDSFLLKKHIKKYAKGICLDMGTGSGIQALEAASSKKVTKAYAVDINREAIDQCRKAISHKKIVFLTSDMFSAFNANKKYKDLKFDTIICNPPYLPEDPDDKDVALDGGRKGYELICRFLNEAKRYIKPNTKILLVFSSLTGKDTIDRYLARKRFRFRELEKENAFFEGIFIYLIEQE